MSFWDTPAGREGLAAWRMDRDFMRESVDKQFHDECGFAWAVHDNKDPDTRLPFGCPTELTARLRWGR